MSDMKIMIASPTTWRANPYTINSYAYNLYWLGRAGYDVHAPMFFDESPLSEARNKAIYDPDRGLLQSDCTHVLTWDTDQVFYNNNMLTLLQIAEAMPEFEVLSGWYLATTGTGTPVVFKRSAKKELGNYNDFSEYSPYTLSELLNLKKTPSPFGSIVEVDGIGMGLCLMKREVFEKVAYPWFLEWSPSMKHDVHHFGEDLWFCDLCAKHDIPIHVALRAYVGHFGKQGFVVGYEDLQKHAEYEGIKEVEKIWTN